MRLIARLAIRRPVPILIFWVGAFVVALFLAGNARDNLHETQLQIPGTESDRAAKLSEQQFGGTISMAVLLKAPPAQERALEREARQLVRRLERIPDVTVLSPWAIGGDPRLAEPPGQALLTLQVNKPAEEISDETMPAVERELDKVQPPVETEISGRAPLVRAINEASLDSLDQGELIAFPILIVLLLLVFRSPVAALVPSLCGLLVTRIGMAVMGGLNEAFAARRARAEHGDDDRARARRRLLAADRLALPRGAGRRAQRRGGGRGVGRCAPAAPWCSPARRSRSACSARCFIAPGSLLVSATLGVIVACVLAVAVGAASRCPPASPCSART